MKVRKGFLEVDPPLHQPQRKKQLLLKLAGAESVLILAVNVLAVDSLAVDGALHAL